MGKRYYDEAKVPYLSFGQSKSPRWEKKLRFPGSHPILYSKCVILLKIKGRNEATYYNGPLVGPA